MTTKSAMWMLATCAAGAIAGCGGTQGVVGDEGSTQTVFQRTVVRLEADGTQTVSTESITAEQQRREVAARRAALAGRTASPSEGVGTSAAAISVDGSCAGSSMWMFDQPGLTGNEICFTGTGYAILNQYNRLICINPWGPCFMGNWEQATASFYAGVDHGWFQTEYDQQYFNPYELRSTVGPIVSSSWRLLLGDPPQPW